MPELEKDEIHHQETEYIKMNQNVQQDANLDGNKNYETNIEGYSNSNPINSELKTKNYHRPFTAPPDPIPRSALRTNSEPPLRIVYPPITSLSLSHTQQYDEESETHNEPIINVNHANDENSKCDQTTIMCNNLNDMSFDNKSMKKPSDKQMNDIKNESILKYNNNVLSSSQQAQSNPTTWHAHVYAKPPKTPTPHTIGDILGWTGGNNQNLLASQMTEIQDPSSASLNQLLNSNLKAAVSDSYRNHQNQFISRRCTSLSESSEDDSGICEQPLNLSITKSRDTSPALSIGKNSASRVKKGEWVVFLYFLF